MRWIRVLRQRARSLFRGAQADANLDRELAYHLEELTREYTASGMGATDARAAARRVLGGVAQVAEECRDHRRVNWIVDLGKDLRFAARIAAKSPGFTTAAVATLALGVGASIAVYALGEGLLLRSLPYPNPDRLVAITDVHVRRGESGAGQENFRDWQSSNTVFERMAYTEWSQVTLTGLGDPERIAGRGVSDGFFELLGIAPQLGRWFTADEQKPGAERVVMLSHALWTRKLGAKPDVVGSSITVNDRPYRIVGVMPDSFRFNEGVVPEYWTPITYRSSGRQQHQYAAYARVKPGVTVAAAQSQMSEIARRLEQAYPDNAGWGVRVRSLRGRVLAPFGPALLLFGAAALIVLLVACGNVASLLLARSIARSKEIAVRVAMGARRGRVARLLLAEGLLLSGGAAVAGIAIAAALLRIAIAAAPPWLQLGELVAVNGTLAAFAVGLTVAVGVLSGSWPAWRGSRADLQTALKEGGAGLVAGRREARSLHVLVVAEIALAVVLLSCAGLLVKSFRNLAHTSLGYRTDGLITFRMPLPASRYKTDGARLQFWDKLLAELGAVPGVLSAAASDSIPLGGTYSGVPVTVEGQSEHRDWADVMSRAAAVTPDYFRTMGIGLRAGRYFDRADSAAGDRVLIVNETFVQKLLPGGQPVGMRVRLGNDPWTRIVGVVADSRYSGPAREVGMEAYEPAAQSPYLAFVSIHTAAGEDAALATARAIVRRLDPQLPMTQERTMRQSVDLSMSLGRQMMTLVAGFAATALLMSTMGLAGVMSYMVSRRRRELGLRMALGADRMAISRGVMRDALRLVAAGAAVGAAGAAVGTRLLESILYGVDARDPAVLAGAPLVLGIVAVLACVLPTQQAASVKPMSALRQE